MAVDILARGMAAKALKEVEQGGGGLDIVELFSDSGNVDLPLPTAFSSPAKLGGACGLLFRSGIYVETIMTEEGTTFVNHITYASTMSIDGIYLLMDITMPTDLLTTVASYTITEYQATVTPYRPTPIPNPQ